MGFVNKCEQHDVICTDFANKYSGSKKHFRRFYQAKHHYRHLLKVPDISANQLQAKYHLVLRPKHLVPRHSYYDLTFLAQRHVRHDLKGTKSWKKQHYQKQYEHNLPAAT